MDFYKIKSILILSILTFHLLLYKYYIHIILLEIKNNKQYKLSFTEEKSQPLSDRVGYPARETKLVKEILPLIHQGQDLMCTTHNKCNAFSKTLKTLCNALWM